jgi:hypothetical protein
MTTFFLCALCVLCARYSEIRLRLRRAGSFVVKNSSPLCLQHRRAAMLWFYQAYFSLSTVENPPAIAYKRADPANFNSPS